jgi:catechol 2,3-dioxygenase-like lactoylglutathione lyase family enzyme
MAVEHIAVVSIPVSDQERAKRFYVDTLGLELVRDDTSVPGMRWIQVAPREEERSFRSSPGSSRCRPGLCVASCSACPISRPTTRTLVAKDVEFEGPPASKPWGARDGRLRPGRERHRPPASVTTTPGRQRPEY